MQTMTEVDLFVIGAGSGGVRAARTAADLGVKVAIAECRQLGGTCINVGCVPKKLFVYASHFSEDFKAAKSFGWALDNKGFDWGRFLSEKNREITRLQNVYSGLLHYAGVEVVRGEAQVIDPHTVTVGERQFHCERILIATGSWPSVPEIPGQELAVTSNEMFTLNQLPNRILIIGGGYIAVEFAGIMHGLGVDTTLCHRGSKLLRGFDEDVRDFLAHELTKEGIGLRFDTQIMRIDQCDTGLSATTDQSQCIETDLVLFATGRKPHSANFGLETVGVELDNEGAIKINEYYQTNIPSIYALGDVTNRLNLTPVATAEAMAFVNQLYTDHGTPLDYDNIPTAVFSQPVVSTVGLTESEARNRYSDIDIYKSVFTPMKHALTGIDVKTLMKMIVHRKTDRVLGAHMVGADAAEIIQGIAIAIRAGATKSIFDTTIGIHPTAAEEWVTMRKQPTLAIPKVTAPE